MVASAAQVGLRRAIALRPEQEASLLVFLAAYSGGGSGTFYFLHILNAASVRAFDEDGSTYSRLNLTLARTYIFGDRWQGDLKISRNSVSIVTNASLGDHGASSVKECHEVGS
jgi:hypothetical protein